MFQKVLILLALSAVLIAAFPNRNGRILGGRNVLPGEIPSMASLRFWGTNFHFAGASLITNRWLVTVANPLVGRAGNSIDIVLGTTMLGAGVVSRRSDTIRSHEQFNSVTRANDIACIRSAATIAFNQFIFTIPLGSSVVGVGVEAQVAGWGATNADKGPNSNILQTVNVHTGACVNNEFFSFTPQHLCAGALDNNSNSVGICTSDIGGPLITSDNVLIGIAVWHDGAACGRTLDGYMRISSFHNWIFGVTT